jgi:hypothetical protein
MSCSISSTSASNAKDNNDAHRSEWRKKRKREEDQNLLLRQKEDEQRHTWASLVYLVRELKITESKIPDSDSLPQPPPDVQIMAIGGQADIHPFITSECYVKKQQSDESSVVLKVIQEKEAYTVPTDETLDSLAIRLPIKIMRASIMDTYIADQLCQLDVVVTSDRIPIVVKSFEMSNEWSGRRSFLMELRQRNLSLSFSFFRTQSEDSIEVIRRQFEHDIRVQTQDDDAKTHPSSTEREIAWFYHWRDTKSRVYYDIIGKVLPIKDCLQIIHRDHNHSIGIPSATFTLSITDVLQTLTHRYRTLLHPLLLNIIIIIVIIIICCIISFCATSCFSGSCRGSDSHRQNDGHVYR